MGTVRMPNGMMIVTPDTPNPETGELSLEQFMKHTHGGGVGDAPPVDLTVATSAHTLVTPRKINNVEFDGSQDIITLPSSIPNHIIKGRDIIAGVMDVSATEGENFINGKIIKRLANVVPLTPRSANLIYDLEDGTTGKVVAKLPEADANTIVRYDFSSWDGVSPIPNSAVGVNGNTIAVANNLTKNGTIARVDGYVGYACQGDAVSGYMVSQNSLGFPSFGQESEVIIVFSPRQIISLQTLINMGGIYLYGGANSNILIAGNGGGNVDSNFSIKIGLKNIVSIACDGVNQILKVNGETVFTYTGYYGVANTLLYALQSSNGTNKSSSEIDYIEIRNKIYSDEKIASISNDLLLPCSYYNNYKLNIGTPIGTLSNLVTTFNDVTTQTMANCSSISGTGILTGTVGKNWGVARIIKRFSVYGSSDYYFTSSNGNFRIRLYGSNSGLGVSPVILWDSGSMPYNTMYLDVSKGIDISTAYQYHWIEVAEITGLGAAHGIAVAELIFYSSDKSILSDIRSIFPADSLVLVYVKTNSNGVIEIDNKSYKYGIRQGFTGGNRIYTTDDFGWFYVGLNQDKTFPNPFGTLNVRGQVYYKKTLTDSHVTPISAFYSSGYGANIKDITQAKIVVHTGDTYIVIAGVGYTGSSETTGYISIIAEVIE